MSNTNGLIECRSVCGAGNTASAFYLRKGQPATLMSPVQITSPDKTQTATLSESNAGLFSVSNPSGSVQMDLGPDGGLVVNTDPQAGGTDLGIEIQRSDNANAVASLKVDENGAAVIDSYQGFAYVRSTQGANEYSMILSADPFTGLCTISNNNNGADGEIIINTATAADSKLTVQVRPNAAVASGITITNVPNAAAQSATVNAGVDGSLELSATTNVVRVIADGNGGGAAGLTVKPATATGISCANLQNSATATNPSIISLYNASATAGGLTSGHFQVFGYSGAGYSTIKEIIDADYDGSSILMGDGSTVGGAVVSVAGPSGSGRVYDTIYNPASVPAQFTMAGFNYPVGSSAVSGASTTLTLVEGKSYLVNGVITLTRNGYAQDPISNGNYVVPGPFSVRFQMRLTGAAPPSNNTGVLTYAPTGNYAFGSPLADEGCWIPVTGVFTCPAGVTGAYLYAFGSDATVEFGTNGFIGTIQPF